MSELRMENLRIKNDLFQNVKCFISGEIKPMIQKYLENGGATILKYTMDKATHVICGQNYDESHINEANELYDIPSVTESWVLASSKLGRLAIVKGYDLNPNKLFSNFVFSMNQIDQPDRKRLYAMITINGGTVQKIFDKNVTHLISGSTQGMIYAKALTVSKAKLAIVTPDWIVDSLKQKGLADCEIYHPRLLLTPKPTVKSDTPLTQLLGFDSEEKAGEKDQKSLQTPARGTQSMPNVGQRPQQQNRPVLIQNMQHTTQQINQILQNQIQQQQAQQKLQQQQAQQQQAQPAQPSQQQVVQQPTPQQQNVVQNTNQNQNPTLLLQQHAQAAQQQLQNQQNQQQTSNTTTVTLQQTQSQPPPSQSQSQPQPNQPTLQQQKQAQIQAIQQQLQQLTEQKQQQQLQQLVNQGMTVTQAQQMLQQQQLRNQQQMQVQSQQQQSYGLQPSQIQQGGGVRMQISQTPIQQQDLQQGQNQNQQNLQANNVQQQQQMQQRQILLQNRNHVLINQQLGELGNEQAQNNQNQQFLAQQQKIAQQNIQNQPQFGGNIQQNIQNPQQPQNIQGNVQQNIQGNNQGNIQNQQQFINQPFKPQSNTQTLIGQTIINRSTQQPQQSQQQHQIILNSNQPGSHIVVSQGGQQKIITQQQQQGQQLIIQHQGQKIIQIPQGILQQQSQQHPAGGNQQFTKQIVIGANQQIQQIQHQQNQQGIQGQSQSQNPQQIVIINQQQGQGNPTQQKFQILQQTQHQPQGSQGQQANPHQSQMQQQQQMGQKPQQNIVTTSMVGNQIVQQNKTGQGNQLILNSGGNMQQQQIIQVAPDGNMDQQQQQQQKVLIQQQQIQQPTSQQQAVQQIAQQLQSHSEGAVQQHMSQGQSQVIGQQIVGQSSQPGTPQPQQVQQQPQWVPQSPTQQPQNIQGSQGTPQSPIVQQIITTPGHIARGVRPRYMYLDAQSSVQFARMDKQQKQEYIEQRGVLMGQQIAFQARPGAAQSGPRHIVIHNAQVNRNQQIQWIQGQGGQVVRVQTAGTPGLAPITAQQVQAGQANVTPVQFQIDPNATPQQQQMQIQLQRQQFQRIQQMKQAGAGPTDIGNPNFQVMDPNATADTTNKTKTALANMLSSRLGGNGNVVVPIVEQNIVEPSAAGTLRMMTAQHNALQANTVPRTPQELLVIQQQQQQQQQAQQQVQLASQRRTLGNITNATPVVAPVPGPVVPGTPVIVPQSPGAIKGQPPFSPGRVPLPRPQFYGHNPNLKLPSELFLLGCHFLIVEYDEIYKEDLPAWKQTIKHHGGEIESCYNPKVTHILCRTQKHGIVMQAIRDNKRCVTAYWLIDCVGKKQVLPPWQAIHLPSPSVFGPLRPGHKHIISISGFEGDERQRVQSMADETGARVTSYLNRQNTVLVCKRIEPTNRKYLKAKELNIPVVNVVWLSDLLLGNTSATLQYESTKYQQYTLQAPLRIDHTIVSHLMNAWKAPINLTQEAHERVKRSQLEPSPIKAKKVRTLPMLEPLPNEIVCKQKPEPDRVPVVLFSCIDKDNEANLIQAVLTLGGRVTQSPLEMTHLLMTHPMRTVKFMYGLCVAKFILSTNWLVDSALNGYFVSEEHYGLKEVELEGIKMDVQLVVNSPIRNRIFDGKVFYLTPSIKPAINHLKTMIEICGGIVEENRRSVPKIHEQNNLSANSYIIISCPTDSHLIQFKQFVCFVCTTEFVMQSIMSQTINFTPHMIKYP